MALTRKTKIILRGTIPLILLLYVIFYIILPFFGIGSQNINMGNLVIGISLILFGILIMNKEF